MARGTSFRSRFAWLMPLALVTAVSGSPRASSANPAVDGVWLPDTLPSYQNPRAVVDSTGDRLLLFEPFGSATRVWSLALDGTVPATLLVPDGVPPVAIRDANLVYDPDSARVLMFGGNVRGPVGIAIPVDSLYELWLRPQLVWERPSPVNAGPAVHDPFTAAMDRVRRRMLVHGGFSQTWALELGDTLRWDSLATSGAHPDPAGFGTPFLVMDDPRARVLLGDSANDTTWTLSLDGPLTWSFVTHDGARPVSRPVSAVAADPAHQRLILLGLQDSTRQALNSAYSLDDATLQWSSFPAIPDPPPLSGVPTAAADPARGVLWMAGLGERTDGVWTVPALGDTAWSRKFGRGADPLGAGLGALWVDATTNRAYFMGGNADQGTSDWSTLWSLPLDGALRFYWSPATLDTGLSPARSDVAWAFDSRRRALLVFGGGPPQGGTLADLRRFDVATMRWQTVPTAGPSPAPRAGARAVYDSLTDLMYMYGGVGASTPPSELWSLALGTSPPRWNLIPATHVPDASGSQSGAALELDRRRRRLCVFGGVNPATSGIWTLDPLATPPTWSPLQTSGTPPPARGYATLTYDPIADRLVAYGGVDGNGDTFADTWGLSLSGTPTWTQLAPDSPPPPRSTHAAAYDAAHDRLLVYGRFTHDDRDLRVLQWQRDQTPLPPLPEPAPRLQLTVLSNPSPAGVTMAVGLVENGDVQVDLLDLAGRLSFTQEFPALSAGPHVLTVAPGIRAGIYWVRVRQGTHQATGRAAILR